MIARIGPSKPGRRQRSRSSPKPTLTRSSVLHKGISQNVSTYLYLSLAGKHELEGVIPRINLALRME
jgi:hypothetical protein